MTVGGVAKCKGSKYTALWEQKCEEA